MKTTKNTNPTNAVTAPAAEAEPTTMWGVLNYWLKRLMKTKGGNVIVAVLLLVAAVSAIPYLQMRQGENYLDSLRRLIMPENKPPARALPLPPVQAIPLRVAIFHPTTVGTTGPSKDGRVQTDGFDAAITMYFDSNAGMPRPIEETFELHLSGDGLLPQMKNDYEQGCRIFIVTMSSAVTYMAPRFRIWRNELRTSGKESPVLIGTVASSPAVATDASQGIYRFYIRSQEEAQELARYGRWVKNVEHVGVFSITHANNLTDAYGEGGFKTFHHELQDLGGGTTQYRVLDDGGDASEKVNEFMGESHGPRTGAFIVGYGNMIGETIAALAKRGFRGPILCASTLTEPTWQPADTSLDANIVTVTPHRDQPLAVDDRERGVVFSFSKLTLLRVLDCAASSPTTQEFQQCWQKDSDSTRDTLVGVMHLANGDAIVPVSVTAKWRGATK